jgi:hypothetical protein
MGLYGDEVARDGEAGSAEPVTVDLADGLALRIYADRRPGNLELAGVHKALILVRGGVELVEEGAGFGLPIARYRDKTLFPGSATLKMIQEEPYPVIEKTYELDTISVKSLGGSRISDTLYHPAHRIFNILYLSLNTLRPAFDKIMEFRNLAGMRTNFLPTTSRGRVRILYTIYPEEIQIEAYAELGDGCEELILLNEQGASTFRRYDDAHSMLIDDKMGAWDKVDVAEATFSTLDGELSFTVFRPSGAVFWRGRERVRGRLSWAGLTLSFSISDTICYKIKIGQRTHSK